MAASLGNPRSWVPYMNNKDCSQGFCSLYCPQWCYIVYPPPPPFELPEDNSSPSFSPLVVAVIGILASALLLVSYYTIISRYCGNNNTESSSERQNLELEQFHGPNYVHEQTWQVSPIGLDEALIKSITVFKYKKEDGLASVTDCSVCLSEFNEDESIKLLPKCSHAFHIPCIDTWLKSNSSCPLCRAGIFSFNDSSLMVCDSTMENSTSQESQHGNVNNEVVVVDLQDEVESEETRQRGVAAKPTLRAMSDLGNLQGRHGVIEIKDEGYVEPFTRSVSMDHSFQSRNRIVEEEVERSVNEAGPSKRSNGRRKMLQCVLSPIVMKRSFSSGRFSVRRGRQGIIPI